MTVWVVHGGRYGEREAEALDNGVLTIGYGLLGDLSGVSGRDGFTEVLRNLYSGGSQHQPSNYSRQIRSFVEEIQPDDLAVMPRKGTDLLAVGVFNGGYLYRSDKGDFAHGRRVRWLNTEVSRDLLQGDLKRSVSANSTVFRPRAPGAEERLRVMAKGCSPVVASPYGGSAAAATGLDSSLSGAGSLANNPWWRWLFVPPAWLVGLFVPAVLVGLLHNLFGPESWIPFVETAYTYFTELAKSTVSGLGSVWLAAEVAPAGKGIVAICGALVVVLVMLVALGVVFLGGPWDVWGVGGSLWRIVNILITAGAGVVTAWQIHRNLLQR